MSKVVITISDEETGLEGEKQDIEEEGFDIDFYFDPNIQSFDVYSNNLTQSQAIGLSILLEFGFEIKDIVEDNYIH